MNGLELSKEYYLKVGRPMLEKNFPDVLPRIATGLSGEGSECLGFDDETSHDHDFGPGFCIWLTDDDFRKYGALIQAEYDRLPKDFSGFQKRNETLEAGRRVGVMSISAFYAKFLGDSFMPLKESDWNHYEECLLATATNGEVFEDGPGEFSRIRNTLSYYPYNVWVQKAASSVHLLSQAGQYNYERSLKRGEKMAALLSISHFMEESIHLSHLLSKRYEPYYKWAWRSFTSLPDSREISSLLSKLPEYAANGDDWRAHIIIEKVCSHYVASLNELGLSDTKDTFLEAHVHKISEKYRT
ncbi:MAG: DUF4037 domain-containing protein [Lachnospiraceae bacterium]|nr:DUF4037 domain-containing protein [Lachnospiraceae bacterium]